MPKKTENYSRQLKYLLVLGDEIIKEDGVFREGTFFSKLREFINFYKEIKLPLSEIVEEEKQQELSNYSMNLQTQLKFVNYQYPSLFIFILMFLDMILAIGYSDDRFQLLMIEYGKQLDPSRNKICRWIFVPLGWFAGAYFLTEGFGCMSFFKYASC